ncbi:MAG: GNAT family N-acetyltransferase [Pseudomonadota bacterium]
MKIDLPPEQRQANRSDWKAVGDITAEAFAEDPVNLHVFGSARAIKTTMRIMARDVYLKHGLCFLHGERGATMWVRPGDSAPFSGLAMLKFAAGMAVYASHGALARATRLGERMAKHHPETPHMYLFTIGARASARGKGVGKALLAPVLAACDRDGVPVYLENSNPANAGFYRAHGFETITKFEIGDPGSPVMEPMWREPTSSGSQPHSNY